MEVLTLLPRTLHYSSQYTYNLTAQPWNGFCTLEEFYNSYEDMIFAKGMWVPWMDRPSSVAILLPATSTTWTESPTIDDWC